MSGNGPGQNGQCLLWASFRLVSERDADVGFRVESGVGIVGTAMGTGSCGRYVEFRRGGWG